jgi:4-hydroxy-2-oxoheptanedioate aldolase
VNQSFAERFRSKQPVLGVVVYSCSPIVVEDIAYGGVDFVFIDMEHTPIAWEPLENMVRAAQVARAGTVVRVTENNPSHIRKAFEAGADCVTVPHIASKKDAEAAVKSARFPPRGERGATSYARVAKYAADWSSFLDETNKNVLLMAMIEEQEAIDNIEGIASTEGLAGLNFGPLDYAVSTGVVNSPERQAKTKEATRVVARAGKKHNLVLTAALPPTKEEFDDLLKLGYSSFLLGYDLAVLRKFASDGAVRFQELLKGARAPT